MANGLGADLAQAAANAAATVNVRVALADAAIKKIRFDHGGMAVRPSCFAEVSKAIGQDRIKVVVVSKLSSAGVYDCGTDRIELRSPEITSPTRKALIVHECLHAWMDLQAIKTMKIKTSEAAAYLAQCIFARAKLDDPADTETRLYDDEDAAMDDVYVKAWSMAGDVLLRGQNPSNADFAELEDRVARTVQYSREANHRAKWNGVPKP